MSRKRKKSYQSQKRFDQDRHHNLAESRGGESTRGNIIWLTRYKHERLHQIFGNKTLTEIIELLLRLDKLKKTQSDGHLRAENYKQRFSKRPPNNSRK